MAIQWITAADLDQPTADTASTAAAYASYVLYKLTGEKFSGTSTSTDLYTAQLTSPTHIYDYGAALEILGIDLRYMEHVTIYEAYDTRPLHLYLRSKPIQSVTNVVEGNRILAAEEYWIGNKRFLRKLSGQPWELRSGIAVEYVHGTPVPEAAKLAAKALANQMVLLETDPDACMLPDRVTSVSRQGVSFTILDPQAFLKEGRTGIYDIDLFIKTVNPDNARKRAKIFSPDIPRGIRNSN